MNGIKGLCRNVLIFVAAMFVLHYIAVAVLAGMGEPEVLKEVNETFDSFKLILCVIGGLAFGRLIREMGD